MSRLQWTGPGQKPVSFELQGAAVSIGRREENDLVLPFGYVSGKHARLEHAGGRWTIQDLDSTNGTKVNGRPANDTPLANGDLISLGSLDMRFTDGDGEPTYTDESETHVVDEPDAFATLAHLSPGDSSDLEKLSLLLDLQAQWGDGFTSDATIHRILSSALTLSGAERACLLCVARASSSTRPEEMSTATRLQRTSSTRAAACCRRSSAAAKRCS